MAINTTRFPLRGMNPRSATTRRNVQPVRPSDDEILGLVTSVAHPAQNSAFTQHQPKPYANVADSANPAAREPAATLGAGTGASAHSASAENEASASNVAAQSVNAAVAKPVTAALTPELAQILDAHPQLRAAWDAAQQFQSVFATPAAAQDAKSQLDELDEMFFSADPTAQAALAAHIHELSPEAFHSLAQAMQAHAAQIASSVGAGLPAQAGFSPDQSADAARLSAQGGPEGRPYNSAPSYSRPIGSGLLAHTGLSPDQSEAQSSVAWSPVAPNSPAPQRLSVPPADPRRVAQLAFFHSTNSAAVHQILAGIESQVAHLLPASVSAPTKTRIVGEIYRDLSSALGANRQLGHQLRQAFRSGAGDAAHQRAIVSLVTGRARQALPSIARRVINEWTHGVVSANQEKLARQSASAKRVDISGAASSDGVNRKPLSPREVDYKRLSDADILNL